MNLSVLWNYWHFAEVKITLYHLTSNSRNFFLEVTKSYLLFIKFQCFLFIVIYNTLPREVFYFFWVLRSHFRGMIQIFFSIFSILHILILFRVANILFLSLIFILKPYCFSPTTPFTSTAHFTHCNTRCSRVQIHETVTKGWQSITCCPTHNKTLSCASFPCSGSNGMTELKRWPLLYLLSLYCLFLIYHFLLILAHPLFF